MLSPHISSAFAQERQTRYRREAADERLAGRRARLGSTIRRSVATRTATADPPTRRAPTPCAPSPAH
jgi:hypothetical protein